MFLLERKKLEREDEFHRLFEKYWNLYADLEMANINIQFAQRVERILKRLKQELSLEVLCDLMRKVEDIVKTEIYVSEETNLVKRREDLERITKEIKEAEKSAKRFIGVKKYQVLDEIKKEIFEKISVGEAYNELKHNVNRALVTQDIFPHKDAAEKFRKKVQQDLKEDIKIDLLKTDEISRMKKDLKEELLKELRQKPGVC